MFTGQKAPSDLKNETNLSKLFSVLIIFAFITFVLWIILTQWMHFLPQMEEAGEETKELIESRAGSNGVHVIQSDYISEIRQAQAVSFVCFGILDGIFAFLLWKKPLKYKDEKHLLAMGFLGYLLWKEPPKNKDEKNIIVMGFCYPFIRWFSAFVIIMISIAIITTSISPSALYVVIAIFSGISIIFILYLRKSISSNKLNTDVVFKVPNEIIS